MQTDKKIAICGGMIIVGFVLMFIISMYKVSKDCAERGGVLVQGAFQYVCVPAAGEKK